MSNKTPSKTELPTPHGDKLRALLENEKLPSSDAKRIQRALERYQHWLAGLRGLGGNPDALIRASVDLLNQYRLFLDLEVVFDSSDDFLYRQKGQLKLDNSVVEEFLPHLVSKTLGSVVGEFEMGPRSCFSALYFASTLATAETGPKLRVRGKDQDFTISRRLHIKASFDREFARGTDSIATSVGYLCAECKTNLDKTMFQEAVATAHDVKTAVPGAKYLLLCEWLDMTPIGTVGTDIDEVLLLRKAKRIGSHTRAAFASKEGRRGARKEYEKFLRANPFAAGVFERFVAHIRALLDDREPHEDDVLAKGYF